MARNPQASHRAGLALLALLGLFALAGGEAGAADALPGGTQTVHLEYRELDTRITGWRLKVTPRAEPFRQEPDWGGKHVCRGVIHSAFRGVEKPGTPPGHSINLPFAWDYLQGKLHLDLSRSGDLTQHAAYSTKPGPGDYFYQDFTNLHLAFAGDTPSHEVLVDIALYTHKGQDVSGGNLTWRCFWQGKAVLQGHECQVGLIEHPNHLGSTQEAHLLLRPWNEREGPFSLGDGRLTGFEYCTNLFACGQAYRLTCSYLPADVPKFKLEISEQPVELGEVELTGKFIQRVVFSEHRAKVPYTVVLDRPEPKVRIPVGTYHKHGLALKEKDTEAICNYRDWLRPKPVTISAANPAVAPMGGPLTNWVKVTPQGRTLTFDYELLGAGGRYRMAGEVDRSKPPQLAIYQNGKPVGSGKFEFG